jgi:histidinol-phosphate aminotransferase
LSALPNPNPPIGTLYSRAQIAELCKARSDRLVVIDEAYVDFAPRDSVPLLHEYPNLAVTRTFSKSFSLAGMRIGYLLASPELITELMKIKDSYNLSHLAQVAGAAAIAGYSAMRENATKIIEERQALAQALSAMGYRVPESHGNFLFAFHPDARAHFLALHKRGILIRHFDTPGLRDGMRITIGTPRQMQALLDALREILTPGEK